MKNEIIKANSISEYMLAPHLRNKQPSTNVSVNIEQSQTQKTGIAGETIESGQLIFKSDDGKWYLAECLVHQAEYVATTSATIDEEFTYDNDVEVSISSPVTVWGDVMLLGANGNMRKAVQPDVDEIYQRVGEAKGNGIVAVKIEPGILITA